jgi:hypothetical protein
VIVDNKKGVVGTGEVPKKQNAERPAALSATFQLHELGFVRKKVDFLYQAIT